MICNSCKNEFDNNNGQKFCPYCGTKAEIAAAVNTEPAVETREEAPKEKSIHDTLRMPVITKEDIWKYQKEKFLKELTKPFKGMKIAITIVTLILFMAVGVVGYLYLTGKPVDEGRIKEDITGKVLLLPKGTSFEIKKGYIKSFKISERNTSKNDKKDDIKAAVTFSDGSIEVKTLLSLQYVYEGGSRWKISDKLELGNDTTVKPLSGMNEKQLLEEVKKFNIMLNNTPKALSDEDVKSLAIASRTPDFDNSKEVVLVDAAIDNGVLAASGKIKGILSFENEAWKLSSVERDSAEDFVPLLSSAFSEDKLMEAIKKEATDQKVSSTAVFGGKQFYASDNFTKSIKIGDKKFDEKNQNLNVTVKSENEAGVVKTVLSTDYTFNVSLKEIKLIKKSKTEVDSVSIGDVSRDTIVTSITGAEIEGNYILFLYSNNHKITAEEAKTFKTTKTLSKKGLENIRYVYGSVTYKEGSKTKTTNVVATYFLVYDKAKGYSWKLDRIVGEDSPNYRMYN